VPAWLDRLLRRYRAVAGLGDLSTVGRGRVEVEGTIEGLELLADPIDGDPCVAMDYRAWPPSTTMGIDGGTSYGSRAYQVNAREATDFVLADGEARVLVVVDRGDDIGGLHRRMLAQFGVGLRAEVDVVSVGSRVRVAGELTEAWSRGSPHRSSPYSAVVRADRVWQPQT
jgi:hypothetical protein